MKAIFLLLWRILQVLLFLAAAPILIGAPLVAIAVSDLLACRAHRGRNPDTSAKASAASIVIPNWNGRDLLEKYLPSVLNAISGNTNNEIIVVDNASTDGSVEYLRTAFPNVRVISLEANRGFGGGSNAGVSAARNDIVVLLNSDMRVEPDFLPPLLENFEDEKVFAVSCQIFFSDPNKVREETGLTQGWWENGGLRVSHRIDSGIQQAYPCFYGGGGSCAFDRKKFSELGGFDELYWPFYLEDTDLGYMAWKRGWKVLYEPRSRVFHEHRGTIGKHFERSHIEAVLKKNFVLFAWKNIHDWRLLGSHFFFAFAGAVLSIVFGESLERPNVRALARALAQLPQALRSRLRSRRLAYISDAEAFRRPLGGYFRDRFHLLPKATASPSVLFVSPYPLMPPVHGGGVFMYQTTTRLAELCRLHLIILLDHEWERDAHSELVQKCASVEFLIRPDEYHREIGSPLPHAVVEYANSDLEWLIHRQVYLQDIDVIQLEYTALAQYATQFRQIPCILFEHDVYFQSIGRGLHGPGMSIRKLKAMLEYLRALRYELGVLARFDRVQVCSQENGNYLLSFRPELRGRIDSDLRAGIDTSRYEFRPTGPEPRTMLFLGSFRHLPNQEAINWFTKLVLPHVVAKYPDARLVIVGSDPPPRHSLPGPAEAIELRGFVPDVREPLARYAVFVCPILSGSGMRVKLLEAFAAGIPVVSTYIGAEGLAQKDGEFCLLADKPEEFASRIVQLFENPELATDIARRARLLVEQTKDMGVLTRNLVESYRKAIAQKRAVLNEAPDL